MPERHVYEEPIYVSLPLADKFYRVLTRKQENRQVVPAGADSAAPVVSAADAEREAAQAEESRQFRERVAESSAVIKLPLRLSLSVQTVLGIGTASIAARGSA